MSARDDLVDLVELRTNKFAPFLPDDCQVNPGVYGAELAYWLAQQLAARGIVTSYPAHEDWGWYLDYVSKNGAEFALHCGNVDGQDDSWLLSLRRHSRKMFGRDKPSFDEASGLIETLRTVLLDAEIATHWLP